MSVLDLASTFVSFESDWDTWEMHPAGDELVCLLSGRAAFEFEGRGTLRTRPSSELKIRR